MSVASVKAYLRAFGKEDDVQEFPVSSATVELAAQALQVIPARIAKTLSFAHKDGHGILLVAAGDAPEEVIACTGHAVGGVCPFAIPDPHTETYLDRSLLRFSSVFPAAGSANSAVEMTCDELYAAANARGWVDVCKGWQTET